LSGLFVATGTRGLFLHSDFGLCCEFAVISRRFAVEPKIPSSFRANTKAVEAVLLGADGCLVGRFGWKAWCWLQSCFDARIECSDADDEI
jgi:hypothetical protein